MKNKILLAARAPIRRPVKEPGPELTETPNQVVLVLIKTH